MKEEEEREEGTKSPNSADFLLSRLISRRRAVQYCAI